MEYEVRTTIVIVGLFGEVVAVDALKVALLYFFVIPED